MSLIITGKIITILDVQSGESKNGLWRKQDFIVQTTGDYPKTICLTLWGENIDKYSLSESENLTAYIDIKSREFNGRWYTDVKAWKIEKSSTDVGDRSASIASSGSDHPFTDNDDEVLPF